jgi:hypothetical protein
MFSCECVVWGVGEWVVEWVGWGSGTVSTFGKSCLMPDDELLT